MRKFIPFVVLLALLSGCAKPVPADKADFVGEWHGQAMTLEITQEGNVHYKRVRGNNTTSVDGPLRRFEGNNFVVGIPLISTTFEVSKPPYRADGTWKMVVDGVELTRAP
jgi:hypothetical protein